MKTKIWADKTLAVDAVNGCDTVEFSPPDYEGDVKIEIISAFPGDDTTSLYIDASCAVVLRDWLIEMLRDTPT